MTKKLAWAIGLTVLAAGALIVGDTYLPSNFESTSATDDQPAFEASGLEGGGAFGHISLEDLKSAEQTSEDAHKEHKVGFFVECRIKNDGGSLKLGLIEKNGTTIFGAVNSHEQAVCVRAEVCAGIISKLFAVVPNFEASNCGEESDLKRLSNEQVEEILASQFADGQLDI